jgi:excisionase family DNA binding protein
MARDRLLYDMDEARGQIGGLCRRQLERLIARGELESVTVGRRRMVPADALKTFVDRLRAQQNGARMDPRMPRDE